MQIVQIGPYPISLERIQGGIEASVYGLVQELAKSHTVDVFDEPRLRDMDRVERYGNPSWPMLYMQIYAMKYPRLTQIVLSSIALIMRIAWKMNQAL